MSTTTARLDKSLEAPVEAGFGTISIRVVVLDKKAARAAPKQGVDIDDAQPDELLPETGSRPTSGFLEEPKRGRFCCVFLINGQRQHAWDNAFIVRDLELKYLRNRMLVVVDCDGLKPEAIADLMQGSRHQFYEGKVYAALEARVLAALKADPDLLRLEEEAEDDISSLQAGDEAVKAALDQLIDSHHAEHAEHVDHGHSEPGDSARDRMAGALDGTEAVVVEGDSLLGTAAGEPVLAMRPDVATIRLKPDEPKTFLLHPRPQGAWSENESMIVTVDPPLRELQLVRSRHVAGEDVTLKFAQPEDFEEDEYPIETTLRGVAMFKGHDEPRILERRVVITPRRRGSPPPLPKPLTDDPSFLKVTSRSPIKLVLGGADLHVKLRWDGKDALVSGRSPEWSFRVVCESPSVKPPFFITKPTDGRLEVLISSAPGLTPGEQLKFDVEAVGPGKTLATSFLVDVVEPPSPRKAFSKLPVGGNRRPPYDLIYLKRADWENAELDCFGVPWSGEHAGSFEAPTAKSPLKIFINQDMDLLTAYQESLIAKKLSESTIQQRINKYTAHVGFHLYQMYERAKNGPADGENALSEDGMREEIGRVSKTLIRLMEVSG